MPTISPKWLHRSLFVAAFNVAIVACALFTSLTSFAAPNAAIARCPFDNETTSLTREGLLYLRYALGLRNAALTNNTRFDAAHASVVGESIQCATCLPQLDINGNGQFDMTDAQVIARFLAGLRGTALTTGVTSNGGTRNSEAAMQSFVEAGCSVPSAAVILAAGDIAACGADPQQSNAAATRNVLRTVPGVPVLTLGDNVYADGTPSEFATCFAPTWGVELPRLKPSPGNHDYNTLGATGYYDYFGRLAGASNRGYHSYDVGDWHIVSLNSNIDAATGSVQELWLRNDLANTSRKCTLAYWHHPVFTSSPRGDNPKMADIWKTLYDFKTDIVLTGHEHNYERFAKQTQQGVLASDGIRQFIVGSGGVGHTAAVLPLKPNSEKFEALTYGVLKLTLKSNAYDWEFLPTVSGVVVDSGSANCNRP
jgi:acid phosphatase type 7